MMEHKDPLVLLGLLGLQVLKVTRGLLVHKGQKGTLVILVLQDRKDLPDLNPNTPRNLTVRIGIHCGPVIAGVIGKSKFIYDLWGDTVNIASRMESHGEPGKIQISRRLYEVLQEEFNCEPRGLIEIKGKRPMQTYFLLSEKT